MVAEARSADEPVLTRRCVIMKVADFTTEKYLQAQKQNAAAILILLPQNMSSVSRDTVQVTSQAAAHCKPVRPSFLIQFLNMIMSQCSRVTGK